MLVTFISQCEKKALKRTRRVLDAFANRIGDNVWHTAITEEGLDAVKKLLRKTASKSTAVACHRVRARKRTELIWVVGNRRKFNAVGIVPVNTTENDLSKFMDKQKWHTLPVIIHASAIVGLFHDFGKATLLFQDKLNPNEETESFEPYRHEWVSVRFFQAFVAEKTDEQWLTDLANSDINLVNVIKDGLSENFNQNPLGNREDGKGVLPPFARLVAWLILSHHKLPQYPDSWQGEFYDTPSFDDIAVWVDKFNPTWNSPKSIAPEQQSRIDKNWAIHDIGLPSNSFQWKSTACLMASKAKRDLLSELSNGRDWLHDELFTSHISRMALMLADHHFSSLALEETIKLGWRSENYPVYANTQWLENGDKVYKQQLDEHLVGVATHAKYIASSLPKFLNESEGLSKNSVLQDSVLKTLKTIYNDKDQIAELHEKFAWQDDAKAIAQKIGAKTKDQGFFGINMASTGCGKTIANAKIMYALGMETGKVRFNVALGLRTLTLQTGREFQDALNLSDEDLSVAVGGIAVKALFENQRKQEKTNAEIHDENPTGSESEDNYLNPDLHLHFSGDIKDHPLSEWTRPKGKRDKNKERIEKLIQPPVLVCTIDHLIPATEGIKGGQQIAPMLRLLSSDLILDEPDDFGLSDLPALCRLVHWSGMLGSRVLLSTATMPPAFVYACFEAYQAGWAEYAKANLDGWDGKVQCAWFDERGKSQADTFGAFDEFKKQHNAFVTERVKYLAQQSPKRIGKIIDVTEKSQKTVYENMAETIYRSINELHLHHHLSNDTKNVSIGLVRMANIDPMIAVVKALMAIDAPENTCLHYCVYHSRFPMAVRSHIEEKLDFILKRKDPNRIWTEKGLGEMIKDNSQHHIFVVLASPVAEVGRDHDYDWAVVEPSSMRSIIQLAGRVLRHRDSYPETANIHLLNKNIKALKGKEICFEKPGFESTLLKMTTHKLKEAMKAFEYECINANMRIELPKDFAQQPEDEINSLNILEHKALFLGLLIGSEPANAWWTSKNHWTGEIQSQQRFRKSKKDESYYLYYENRHSSPVFKWLDIKEKTNDKYKPANTIGTTFHFLNDSEQVKGKNIYDWFDLNPLAIYQKLSDDFDIDIEEASRRFGEIKLVDWDEVNHYQYHTQLGVFSIV